MQAHLIFQTQKQCSLFGIPLGFLILMNYNNLQNKVDICLKKDNDLAFKLSVCLQKK